MNRLSFLILKELVKIQLVLFNGLRLRLQFPGQKVIFAGLFVVAQAVEAHAQLHIRDIPVAVLQHKCAGGFPGRELQGPLVPVGGGLVSAFPNQQAADLAENFRPGRFRSLSPAASLRCSISTGE